MKIKSLSNTNYNSNDTVERKEYKAIVELSQEEKDIINTYLNMVEKLKLNATYKMLSFNENLDEIEITCFNDTY